MSTLRITYRKSAIGYARDQKATIAALGLRRLHQTVELLDTPALRGMVHKVRHLVSIEGVPADSPEGVALLAARPVSSGAAAVAGPAVAATATGAGEVRTADGMVAEGRPEVSTEAEEPTTKRRRAVPRGTPAAAEDQLRRGPRPSTASGEEADRG